MGGAQEPEWSSPGYVSAAALRSKDFMGGGGQLSLMGSHLLTSELASTQMLMAVRPFITARPPPPRFYLCITADCRRAGLAGGVTHADTHRCLFYCLEKTASQPPQLKTRLTDPVQKVAERSFLNPPAATEQGRRPRHHRQGGTFGCYRRRWDWMARREALG